MENNPSSLNQLFSNDSSNVFRKLFYDYYTNLCRFSFTFVKDYFVAEEIVQDLYMYLWEQKDVLHITTSLRAFLYTSVKNRSLNYIRNEKTRVLHEDEFAREQQLKVSQMLDFCEQEELSHIIDQAIAELPEQCRLIFEMSRKQQLTYNEIAAQLNLSPKTIESQMGLALKKLRKRLAPYLSKVIFFLNPI